MSFQDEHKIETYKSLISISTEGFKALQYLNGGASVAVLTYLGSLKAHSPEALWHAECPLMFFIFGLICATGVYFTSYATQFALHNENGNKSFYTGAKHQTWLGISIILCSLSLLLFSFGAIFALDALTKITSTAC